MGLLAGKRALIVGVATDRSIAWGIAEAMHAQGAELAFSYANDKFKERVEPLASRSVQRLLMARRAASTPDRQRLRAVAA
jgi:enoyl-[acyl-carrier protein] reductase I